MRILTVTDKGYGKRTELDAYRIQNRGGFGLLNYKTGEEKGYVCGIKVVDETDDIILISNDGIIIRIRCADVRIMGRYATGVKVTRAEHDEEAEVETVDQPSEEEIAQDMANAQAEELENNTVEETEEPENSEE